VLPRDIIGVIRDRNGIMLRTVHRAIAIHRDDPVAIREGEPLEHHAVNDAEHRRREPDAERERHDRHDREARAFQKRAESVANISKN